MKVTRRVDTVTIEVDVNDAEKIAAILAQVIDFTDMRQESFQPLVRAMEAAGVRTDGSLYTAGSRNGFPTIDWTV